MISQNETILITQNYIRYTINYKTQLKQQFLKRAMWSLKIIECKKLLIILITSWKNNYFEGTWLSKLKKFCAQKTQLV